MKSINLSILLALCTVVSLLSCNNKAKYESQIADLKKVSEEAESQIVALEAKLEQVKGETSKTKKYTTGVWFKVQIGAYNNLDLTQYAGHQNFGLEKDQDGTMKYTLGAFRSYADATSFKKLMRNMGVRGAWIVAYKNGDRVEINAVL